MTKQSQSEECYQDLKTRIINCTIKPGTQLTEKELIKDMSYGRTPIREAFAKLESEGFVTSIPRGGYKVTEIDTKSVVDIFDITKAFAPLVVRKAVEKMNNETLSKVKIIAENQHSDDTALSLFNKDKQIFDLLAESTGNRQLIFINELIGSVQERIFFMYLGTEEGRNWQFGLKKLWLEEDWHSNPELAEALIFCAMTSASSSILKLISQSSSEALH